MTGADTKVAVSHITLESILGRGDVLRHARAMVDTALISAALRRTKGCQVRAARLLCVHRNTLWKRMAALGLPSERKHWL
jgi:DNA-binding NtrC family response regulator